LHRIDVLPVLREKLEITGQSPLIHTHLVSILVEPLEDHCSRSFKLKTVEGERGIICDTLIVRKVLETKKAGGRVNSAVVYTANHVFADGST